MKIKAFFPFFLSFLFFSGSAVSPILLILEKSSFLLVHQEPLKFYGYTEENCYVVGISSSHPIHVEDFDFEIYCKGVNVSTTGAYFAGVCLTNCSYFSTGFGGNSESNKEGNLQYLHFEFGKLNFTYDNRPLQDGLPEGSSYYTEPYSHILPPGTWYFIFAQSAFDIEQEQIKGHISVWINLSDYNGVSFATTEGGKIYALWDGEFNAKIVISKFLTFELMIGGNVTFHINNSFVYTFWSFPCGQGFWKAKLIKPDGKIEEINTIIIYGHHFPDRYLAGIGGSGEYILTTSSLDYWPFLNRFLWHLLWPYYKRAMWVPAIYFIGLDIKFPQF